MVGFEIREGLASRRHYAPQIRKECAEDLLELELEVLEQQMANLNLYDLKTLMKAGLQDGLDKVFTLSNQVSGFDGPSLIFATIRPSRSCPWTLPKLGASPSPLERLGGQKKYINIYFGNLVTLQIVAKE